MKKSKSPSSSSSSQPQPQQQQEGNVAHRRVQYIYTEDTKVMDGLECTICEEPFVDVRQTPCDHQFCAACIEDWLKRQNKCI
jgi:formylmethanofuran dehydrogenase subunit E